MPEKQKTNLNEKRWPIVITFLVMCLAAGTVYIYFFDVPQLLYWGKKNVYWPILNTFKESLFNPLFLVLVPLFFSAQYFFPANKNERKILRPSLAQDIVYVFLDAIFRIMITSGWIGLLTHFYDKHLSFLSVQAIGQWPEAVRLIWGIMIADFVFWFHHWVRHRVPWFWQFHTVHHSQKHMNMFTDDRYHFVEYIVENFFNVLILSMFAVGAPEIIYFTIFRKWYTRFYHSSVKTNFGPLKYILVTPQSHRVHHSIEPRHQDKNFGVLFSIWDHMFATQWRNYDEYPETGIEDEEFPHETSSGVIDLLVTPILQTVYPFVKIFKSFKRDS